MCLWSTAECGYVVGGGPGPRGKFPKTTNDAMEGKSPSNPRDFHFLMAMLRDDISPDGTYHYLVIVGEELVFNKMKYVNELIFQDSVTGECLFDLDSEYSFD